MWNYLMLKVDHPIRLKFVKSTALKDIKREKLGWMLLLYSKYFESQQIKNVLTKKEN